MRDIMSLPSSELQAWLNSQFPEGVPNWEMTEDSLAVLSSVYRRHTRREEEARLELEGLEMARQEYTGEAERLSQVLRGAGPGIVESLSQGPAQSYADNLATVCALLDLDSSQGCGLVSRLAELLVRKAENTPVLGKLRSEVDTLRLQTLSLHETLSRAQDLASQADREREERERVASSKNTKGEFISKKCQEYKRSERKMEAVLAKTGGNDPRVKHSEIRRLRAEVERLQTEQTPLARQCSAFATLPPSVELARARLASAQQELEHLDHSLSGALTGLHL